MKLGLRERNIVLEVLVEYLQDGDLLNEKVSKLTPYQKAQRNRRMTVGHHTSNPAKQSVFYKHAVRAIFQKLRKGGENFKQSAKGGQLIAQWMLKKYGYASGSTADPWAAGGKFALTAKGKKRNQKHLKEPKSVLKRKEQAYNYIMGIQKRQAAKRQAVAARSRGAG